MDVLLCVANRLADKMFEQCLRQTVFLPSKLRMPLNGRNETIRSWIFERFNNSVRSPRRCHMVFSERLDGLVMVTIDHGRVRFR